VVDRDGVEPPQSATGGLQPLGLANAQPIQYLVREEGFEPPAFTLWEQIYSLLQHHRRCRSRIA
jgi:hypothetical protein